MSSELTEEFNE